VYIYIYIEIYREWPSHNNVMIMFRQVYSVSLAFIHILLHVSALIVDHHQAYIKMLELTLAAEL
jgi:hypothetical protein